MTPPLVSIIIPCHNAAPWLAATLESALAQTHAATETILIDDGSTDESVAIARRYAARGVRIATQPNRGASAARNHGLRLARGEFIQFLDADDLLAPDKIEQQIARIKTAPSNSIAAAQWRRFRRAVEDAEFEPEPSLSDISGLEFMRRQYNEGTMVPPLVWLTPRTLIDAVGGWREDLSLNDDGEFFCRVALASAGIVSCPDARCYYRSAITGSLSRRRDVAALRSLQSSIAANTAALLAHDNSPQTRLAAANAWQVLAYDLYPLLRGEARQAEAAGKALGRATRKIEGGRAVRWTAQVFGWRAAAWVKHLQR